eukprot:TRINITY_DN13180_c5_g1_i1.p1 TRINITY_DN13180_c5_g1~~TRINITY_DN13180_c5_g1_i1.p1  ORF type:complete len:287 (+),score=33.37 TRINITY_DN13180_c5_g1_i1:47-907(+)
MRLLIIVTFLVVVFSEDCPEGGVTTCGDATNTTVMEGQEPPKNPPSRVFIARHGERMDHVKPEWSKTAARGHDSPLSSTGKLQAKDLGTYLKDRIGSNDVVMYSSPFIRAVQTARHAMSRMHLSDIDLSIESCFAETETSVHKKMMLAEKNPRVHQGLCKPVLLSPSDLMSVFSDINLDYIDVASVTYDEHGWEIDSASAEPQTMRTRVNTCISQFLSQPRNSNKDVVIFAHDGVTKAVIKSLTGFDIPKVRYTEVYELHPQEASWSLESSWVPPSVENKQPQKGG